MLHNKEKPPNEDLQPRIGKLENSHLTALEEDEKISNKKFHTVTIRSLAPWGVKILMAA